MFCVPAFADTSIEIGPTFASGNYSNGTFILAEELVYDNKIGLGVGFINSQTIDTGVDWPVERNIFVSVNRYFHVGPVQLSIGPAYFQNTNRALARRFTIGGSIGFTYKKVSIRFRHYSNAGSGGDLKCPRDETNPNGWDCKSNLGQDAITIGYRF